MAHRFFIPQAQDTPCEIVFSNDRPMLAPLAGYSDLPFRLLCREQGAFICVTEMISARGLLYKTPGTGELLQSAPEDQPLIVQLFGGDPRSLGESVLILRQYGYKYFDCNMGCPMRKVLKQKAGAALMADPQNAFAIAREMLAAANQHIDDKIKPARVGFKLRLPPISESVVDFAKTLEDLGASWIAIHPRSCADGYRGFARHEFTALLAEQLTIPVIASGDAMSGAQGIDILRATGAKAVMYARGALANPAIFAEHLALCKGGSTAKLSSKELASLIRRHIELSCQYGESRRAFIKMRSIIPRYVKGLRGVGELRQRLCNCQNWDSLRETLANSLNCQI